MYGGHRPPALARPSVETHLRRVLDGSDVMGSPRHLIVDNLMIQCQMRYSRIVPTRLEKTPSAQSAVAEDPLALEQQVGFALSIAARSVLGVYRPLLDPMGLTHPQYLVMLALWQHDPLPLEALSVKALGALLQLDSGTLSPLLKRLEANGLVRRQRQPRDERSVTVSLTDEGRALRTQAELIPHQVVERLGIDLVELQELHRALIRVIAAAHRAGTLVAADV